ncbi:MAG: hypothetical protein A2W31_05800 [Planctomycetes bacterium RBG_16_64_10]|nr:MAG: hypothetical protein A2W31_05800 [Planctomycetes bacterium RBG_16_64_10]
MALMGSGVRAASLAERLTTLRFHVECLRAVPVPAHLDGEKTQRLAELGSLLAETPATETEFNERYQRIDAVRTWLLANAAEKPTRADGAFAEREGHWTVTTPALTLQVRTNDLAMSVRTPEHSWQFEPAGAQDIEFAGRAFSLTSARSIQAVAFAPGYAAGMTLVFADFPAAPGFELHWTVSLSQNEIEFELAAREPDATLQAINWPKAIETANHASVLSVIPKMQGMLVPGDWPQEIRALDLCNSRSLYMPWWGQIHDGHGVQVILDTSDDAGAAYHHPAGGPTRITPRWYASLGQLRYLRVARYVFDDRATYVRMAKRYRRYVQERGLFVSLAEKLGTTPALAEVIGRPVVHLGALYHFVPQSRLFNQQAIEANHNLQTFDQLAEQLRTLQSKGIQDAYVHLDGWGFYGYDNGHPDVMPVGAEQGGWPGLQRFAETCQQLGYLFAVHDQYRDFYLNAVSFDERLALTRLDGSQPDDSTWCGGPQRFLNPRFAPGYVRRNHDQFAQHGVHVQGAYLDVFAVVPLEESAHPAHPLTRADCARYRRECFDLLRARGYVVSSEEPADYLVRSLHLVHHGPYAIARGQGDGPVGIPAPLFSLVYHDAILLPWEMGDDGGWGIPKGDAGWLHCLLNGGLPYVTPADTAVQVARVQDALALARRVGLAELVNHEFLDASRRRQRTTFSDGTRVTVNFASKDYQIEPPPQ